MTLLEAILEYLNWPRQPTTLVTRSEVQSENAVSPETLLESSVSHAK